MANVVDDHDMKITHVMRGDEWIPSTSRHLLLYKAFGWEPPQFVHLPVILSPTGGKLSKRKGAASVGDFRALGYLPEALFNYLALLGWSPGDDRELMSREEMVASFSLERILSKSAVFDETKLKWFNGEAIRKADPLALVPHFRRVLASAGVDLSSASDERLGKIIEVTRARVQLLGEFAQHAVWFFVPPTSYDPAGIKKGWKEGVGERIAALSDSLLQNSDLQSEEQLDGFFHTFCEQRGIGAGQVMPAVRLALCGSLTGPSVASIVSVLGAEESVHRMRSALAVLGAMG